MSAKRYGQEWKSRIFFLKKLKEGLGADADLTTSVAKNGQPTAYFGVSNSTMHPRIIKEGVILRVHYRLNFVNAVTYTLRIWKATANGALVPMELDSKLLYESASGRADDTEYDEEVTIPFVLDAECLMYYGIEWSAACGNIEGYIEVSGQVINP